MGLNSHNRKTFSLHLNLSSPSFNKSASSGCGRDPQSRRGRPPKDYDALLSPKSVSSLLTTASSRALSTTSHSDASHLASPDHMHHCDVPVPPTTNELSPIDKMKLMRKVRKLSRVLGELPIPSTAEEAATDLYLSDATDTPQSASTISVFSPTSPTSVYTSTKSLRRSATFGHGSSLNVPVSDVQRARSLVSLRPALTINLSQLPPPSQSPKLSPIYTPTSPIVFASSHDLDKSLSGLSRPPSVVYPDVEARIMSHEPPTMFPVPHMGLCVPSSSHRSRHDSTASSVLVPEPNPEQVQRARAAKLTRQLGNGVPPDVLLRAVSPAVRADKRPSTAAGVANGRLLDNDRLPQRSSSLRRGPIQPLRQARRRLSLDLRALAGMSSSTVPPIDVDDHSAALETAKMGKPFLKKSKSAWLAKSMLRQEYSNEELHSTFEACDGDLDQEKVPMNEKQRVAAVKRARKVAQMFGDKPPVALIQITNLPSNDGTSTGLLAVPDSRRNSRTTITSISSVDSTNRHLRDSFVSAISEPASPVVSPDTAFSEATRSSELDAPSPNAPAESVRSLSMASTTSRGAQSVNSRTHLLPHQQAFIAPQPRTPPPFSTMFVFPPDAPQPTPEHSSPREFRARRRQATKLSQFFGVGLQDLADVLPAGIATTPPTPLARSRATSPQRARAPSPPSRERSVGKNHVTDQHQRMRSQGRGQDSAANMHALSTTVEVAAEVRGPFRFLDSLARTGHSNVREMDMREVIQQLRKIK
ncbi:hypothetical protein OBBRIDRAFT_7240 [Obba rivulosa]|uniref:Uncharacterized protein n=1 Tax=Obba rivulosa TaxID=1052685 RepID=A0A8E2J7D3_9APHY|nr:hypothetical protein OBBRIDRAFT_7240 [Obba rivulosa]